MQVEPNVIDVIAANLKRRFSGVSSTVFRLVHVQVDAMTDLLSRHLQWHGIIIGTVTAPQHWGGLGLTRLETVSCGVPVVATRTGAFENLVVPEDLAAQTEAADRLMSDANLRRAKVLAQHQLKHAAETITDVYRKLIPNLRGAP
jgi:glycosyltransferase involved in cell wall biosynthesis